MTGVHNEWVVVTGAGGALGREIATHYARAGRPVLALDLKIEAIPPEPNVRPAAVDLASAEAVGRALALIPSSEPIRLLVNAVGMIWSEPVVAMKGALLKPHSEEALRSVIEANLTAPFIVATAVAARMARKGGGAIVNFSSLSARGIAGQSAYSAAKAGVAGMTRAMAAELGPLSIRVNAIAPGFIDVTSTRAALTDAKIAQYVANTPAGRLGTLQEIISTVEFVANNPFINGAVIDVDGGIRI